MLLASVLCLIGNTTGLHCGLEYAVWKTGPQL